MTKNSDNTTQPESWARRGRFRIKLGYLIQNSSLHSSDSALSFLRNLLVQSDFDIKGNETEAIKRFPKVQYSNENLKVRV